MIREDARPEALSRVDIKVAQHQLADISPIRRHFVTIMNNGDNTITINSNKGHNFPRQVKTPFKTKNNEIITCSSFTNYETGEVVPTIVVFNTDTMERETFRSSREDDSPAFFWVYSQEPDFDLSRLSEVGYRQARDHIQKVYDGYTEMYNPSQYWMQIACYPDDRKTLIINSNHDARYPIAVTGTIETNQGQTIKRKGEYIEIDGQLYNSPVFRWVYENRNEPKGAFDCLQSELEYSQWTRIMEKEDYFHEWHIKNTFLAENEEKEEYRQEIGYDSYYHNYIPTDSGDVLQVEENTSNIQFEEEANTNADGFIARTTGISKGDAATVRKHIHNLVGTDPQMVNLLVDGLKGKVIFPDKTPTYETINEHGEPIHKYIQGTELIRFNCKWIYFLSQELFALEEETTEDIKLTNYEEYEQAMRDITEILSFSQATDQESMSEYTNLIDAIIEHDLVDHHIEVSGSERMRFPIEPPPTKVLKEIEEEEEDPSIPSFYYHKIEENDWDIRTKRNGNLTKKFNQETGQPETFIGYEIKPEHKYNLMESEQ